VSARIVPLLAHVGICLSLIGSGCASGSKLMGGRFPAGIHGPLQPPVLPPLPDLPRQLPPPPKEPEPLPEPIAKPVEEVQGIPAPPPDAALPYPLSFDVSRTLELQTVLESVARAFPLLLAAEQERAIAAGRRLSAEGAFDLNLRTRGVHQDGTFSNDRFDLLAEQATPWHGLSVFGGYRFGFGEFPVYYGDRLTADGGEFRAGVMLPLLRDGSIDRRRALLRQAQLGEPLADAVVQRFRIDYFRAAAHRYWAWAAAGEQYFVADQLLRIARERQAGLEEQFRLGQIAEFVVIDNRRLIAEREGLLVAAERRLQQASFDLSLYLRDGRGNPIVPAADWLPRLIFQQEPPPPHVEQLRSDFETALNLRPELTRFQSLKEQATVELRLAENQTLPALNAAVGGAQDVGKGKQAEGIFQLDRTDAEASLLLEAPLQRRDARGRTQAARAVMTQLLEQERFARDQIVVDVQDAVSNLELTYARLQRAREEQRIAQRVAQLELDRFRKGEGTLLEVNLRELSAAGAHSKVIDALANFYRAQADYRAALGLDGRPAERP
jgi:cobalt-zinc-cadmium efflux system outer membrane protein